MPLILLHENLKPFFRIFLFYNGWDELGYCSHSLCTQVQEFDKWSVILASSTESEQITDKIQPVKIIPWPSGG